MKKIYYLIIFTLIIESFLFGTLNAFAIECKGLTRNECTSDENKNVCTWSFSVGCLNTYGDILNEEDKTKPCDELKSQASCQARNNECTWSPSNGCLNLYGDILNEEDKAKACNELSGQAACSARSDCQWSISNGCSKKDSNGGSSSPKTGEITPTTSHHDPIDICETSGFLKAIQILKTLFKIVCVIIPIILIVTITLDASKLISEPSDFKKVFPIIKNRLLAALIILFIPTVVKITMKVIPKDSNFDNFVKCVENATEENIQDLESREKNN